ncbi:MAG TPA: hypothetical protein ENJ43_03090 [Gammaproteobacteria bacterium]|nr:hypothetical protein [Gammaproteobacteria bacterium]
MSGAETISPFRLLYDIERRIREHMVPLPEPEARVGSWKGVTFRLKEWHLVAKQGVVQEIIASSRTTRVPGTQPWVVGIANIHGDPVPVVDLVDFFWGERSPTDPASRILLVRDGEIVCGILVSEVMGVHYFSEQDLCDEPHPFPVELGDYLAGCYRHGEVLWGEFNMQGLLQSPGIIDLSAN